jgi:hypothetical protein
LAEISGVSPFQNRDGAFFSLNCDSILRRIFQIVQGRALSCIGECLQHRSRTIEPIQDFKERQRALRRLREFSHLPQSTAALRAADRLRATIFDGTSLAGRLQGKRFFGGGIFHWRRAAQRDTVF